MYVLFLNDMRSSNIENIQPAAWAESESELHDLMAREIVPEYVTDERWHRTFRQGGPLEWFNAPFYGARLTQYIPTPEEVAEEHRQVINRLKGELVRA